YSVVLLSFCVTLLCSAVIFTLSLHDALPICSPFSDCVHSASNWSKLALESTIASMRTPPPQHPPPQLIPLQDRRTHAQFHRHYQGNLRPHSDFCFER